MNRAFLIGNLTRDPELRETQNGISVCTFTIAVNKKEGADFIDIVAWRDLGVNCSKYLHKGSKCAVLGAIRSRTYEKNGEKRKVTEIEANEVEFLTRDQNNGQYTDVFETDEIFKA